MNSRQAQKQKPHPGIDARLIVRPSLTTILFYSKRAMEWADKKGIPAKEGIMHGDFAVTTSNASNTGAILQPMLAKRFIVLCKNANGQKCQVKRKGTKFMQTLVFKPLRGQYS